MNFKLCQQRSTIKIWSWKRAEWLLFNYYYDYILSTAPKQLTQVLYFLALIIFPLWFLLLFLLFSGSPLQDKRQLVLNEMQQLQAV